MALSAPARRTWISTGMAVGLAAVVLLTLLGHNRLTDWDEGIYAGISSAMLRGDWLTPHWNGQPWLEKPPLMLWITAGFFRVFGVSEFTARLGSALSGVALVGLLHGWLTLRRGALTAWLSTVILLSTFGFQHVARVGEMDVLLSLGCTAAVIGLCELENGNAAGWLIFWFGFAVAAMTKGAASVTLAITLVLVLALVAGTRRHLGYAAMGFVMFLALVLPWHLAMLHQFGAVFIDQYLGLHVLARATSQIEGHITPWTFYLRVLLVSAAPWVLVYPFALAQGLRKPALRPFALFALVVFLLFTTVQTRLPHYIAPIYPALSVLTAEWLGERIATRTHLIRFVAAAVALYAAAAVVTAGPRRALHSPRLSNGDATPDNREQIALLKQTFRHPSALVAASDGPLLTLRTGSYNPIPTTVFYSGRTVQQVALCPMPDAPRDQYTNDPILLVSALADHQPHLLLADRSLIAQLPANVEFQPIATTATLTLGRAISRERAMR